MEQSAVPSNRINRAMQNFKVTLAYDGTAYCGWQIQPDRPTVQSELQRAIFRLTNEHVSVNCAGRTDAGVHALGQVANFRSESRLSNERWLLGLQHFLPTDIAVLKIERVADDFHATISAKRKTYRYVILSSRLRDVFSRHYAWRISHPLDEHQMKEAAGHLIGTHDFRCFETQGSPRVDTIRTLFEVQVRRCQPWQLLSPEAEPVSDNQGAFLVVEVTGDGFLYNMVRAIAGTLVEVGLGKRSADSLATLIQSGRRADAGQTAPPQGLFLVRVGYGGGEMPAP